jgi:putative methionine-R-sulfoxide reductase with GAF domain
MSGLTVDAIRSCLDGDIPAAIATCAPDGMPNVTLLSQVQYVDSDHVALSYQFFNKTRANILANPFAMVDLVHPVTGATYQLSLRYLRTETEGALFERMKARLAGIASHTGMTGVFQLKGADIYQVLAIHAVPGASLPSPPRPSLLTATRACAGRLAAGRDMAAVLEQLLADLSQHFAIRHAMVLMLDDAAQRLYTVASTGYAISGVGSEIPLGEGVIGVAARARTPIRISHFTSEYVYSRAVQETAAAAGLPGALETKIPLPGLSEPHSQLAVPILAGDTLLGILFAESKEHLRFGYDEEDALATLAMQLGLVLQGLQHVGAGAEETPPAGAHSAPPSGAPAMIRHYGADDSIFIDDDYLIKGVAGAIFWKLVREYASGRRSEFSNRELRLDAGLRLPSLSENLEARLILLERRLAERCSFLRLEKTGRGRFRLVVRRPVKLVESQSGS